MPGPSAAGDGRSASVAKASVAKRESESHSIIVRLPEEEYRSLQATAGLHGTRIGTALELCVSWMLANLDTSLWDDVLKRPNLSRRSKAPAVRSVGPAFSVSVR